MTPAELDAIRAWTARQEYVRAEHYAHPTITDLPDRFYTTCAHCTEARKATP